MRKFLAVLLVVMLTSFLLPVSIAFAADLVFDKYTITVDGETVEVGKDALTFTPEITMYRFGDEAWLKLNEPTVNGAPLVQKNSYSSTDGDTILWGSKDIQFKFYQKLDPMDSSYGAFEYEIIIANSKAGTTSVINNVSFPIQTQGLEFFYQPALTVGQIADGMSRPESVVGSYAVYYSKSGDYSAMGGKTYKSGKAFHIYRPELIDDAGNKIYADINIENGYLTINFSNIQDWLSGAKYPVVIDPTFGYTDVGLSTTAMNAALMRGTMVASPATSVVLSITAYCGGDWTGLTYFKGVMTDNALAIIANGVGDPSDSMPISQVYGWHTSVMATPPAITNGVTYGIFTIHSIGGGGIKYDSVANVGRDDATNVYAIPIDPDDANTNNLKLSIYATYSDPLSVSTAAADNVGNDTATLHGSITSGDTATVRGFEWGTTSGAPYAHSWTQSGSFANGTFSNTVTGLPDNITYYYRAGAYNAYLGWVYGAEQTFTTPMYAGNYLARNIIPITISASIIIGVLVTLISRNFVAGMVSAVVGLVGFYIILAVCGLL